MGTDVPLVATDTPIAFTDSLLLLDYQLSLRYQLWTLHGPSATGYGSPFSGLLHCTPASRSDNHPSYMGHPVPAGALSKMERPDKEIVSIQKGWPVI